VGGAGGGGGWTQGGGEGGWGLEGGVFADGKRRGEGGFSSVASLMGGPAITAKELEGGLWGGTLRSGDVNSLMVGVEGRGMRQRRGDQGRKIRGGRECGGEDRLGELRLFWLVEGGGEKRGWLGCEVLYGLIY